MASPISEYHDGPRQQPGRLTPRIFAACVVLVGTLGLAGWAFDLGLLQTVSAEAAPIRSGAALGFIVAGGALCVLGSARLSSAGRLALYGCGGLLLVQGGLMVGGNWIAGGGDGLVPWASMAPEVAAGLPLTGISLLLLARDSSGRLGLAVAAGVAVVVAALGLLGLVQYGTDAAFGRQWWSEGTVAPQSSLALLLIGFSIGAHVRRGRSSRWRLDRATTLCFLAGALLLVVISGIAYRTLHSFADTTTQIQRSRQVQVETGNLQRNLVEAVAARRLYLESRDLDAQANFRAAAGRARQNLADLGTLTAGNPRQVFRMRRMREILGPNLRRAADSNTTVEAPPAPSGDGERRPPSNDELLRLLSAVNDEEEHFLKERELAARRNYDAALVIVPAGAFGSLFLLSIALFLLNREADDREHTLEKLRAAEQSVRVSERHYRLLFESSPLPMWVYDTDTLRFLAVNEAATSFYGYPAGEFLAMTLRDIRPPEAVPALLAHVEQLPQRAMPRSPHIWTHRKRDGSQVLVEVTSHDLTFNGRAARLVLANDVTMRVRAQAELRELNEQLESRIRRRTAQLEDAVKELESFSYSVSHDLRAPLRHVQGYVALLERATDGQLPDKARRFLKVINDSSVEMGHLIDDLLDFSRMGRTEMRRREVDLNALVDEVRRVLEPATQGRNITWRVAALPRVLGDGSMLRQVLVNLLGNAVKYTRPRDAAWIEIDVAGEEHGRTVFFVRDNGAGFDMQYADKLFGVFQRLHRSDEFEGTGIGLATVRRIVQRHGGRTWAEGAVDRGATIYFTLERAANPAENPSS